MIYLNQLSTAITREERKRCTTCKLDDEEIEDYATNNTIYYICELYLLCGMVHSLIQPQQNQSDSKERVIFERPTTTAVHSDVESGMNVRPKAHLMWKQNDLQCI